MAHLEPSPAPDALLVLAGRATRVPQAAVTSGIPRTITVTPTGPSRWLLAADLDRRQGATLHGMQGVKPHRPGSAFGP